MHLVTHSVNERRSLHGIEKKAWLCVYCAQDVKACRTYRVVEVRRVDVERDVAAVLDTIAAAVSASP